MQLRIVNAAVLLCIMLVAQAARADRVLLVQPNGAGSMLSEAFNRLRAELALQGFEITVVDAPGNDISSSELEDRTRQAGAFAGVSLNLEATRATADVWIADRTTGKISQRWLAVDDRNQAPSLLAVRAADLLRASLRDLPGAGRAPSDTDIERQPPAVAVPVEARPLFQLRAAGAMVASGPELGIAAGGSIALIVRPLPKLGLGVALFGPLLGARYTAENGTASMRQELLLGRASWDLLRDSRWSILAAADAGVYHLQAESEVSAPLHSRDASVYSFAAGGGLEAEIRLNGPVTLGASLHTLFLTPQPVVAIDISRRTLAQPVLLATLGLGVAF